MASDFSQYIIPTYPGINDLPTAPTAQKAGNGSHLIEQHNNFVDAVQTSIGTLEDTTPTSSGGAPSTILSKIIIGDDTASAGERIVIMNYHGYSTRLRFPLGQPPIGGEIWFMKLNPQAAVAIQTSDGAHFKYKGRDVIELGLTGAYDWASIIYVGYSDIDGIDIGWIPSKDALITPVYYAGASSS